MYNLYTMQTDQSLARTQIYLTRGQQTRLSVACKRTATSKSELIRQAINQFLDQQPTDSTQDKAQRLQSLAGLWANRADMADPSAYVEALRAPRFASGA